MILQLSILTFAGWRQQVELTLHVLLGHLLRRLRDVLAAQLEELLACLAERSVGFAGHFGLTQPLLSKRL